MKTELIKRVCDIASDSINIVRVLAVSAAKMLPADDLALFLSNGFTPIDGSYALIKGETMVSCQNVKNPEPDPDAVGDDRFIRVYLVISPDNTVKAYPEAGSIFEPDHVLKFYNDIRTIIESGAAPAVRRTMMMTVNYKDINLMELILDPKRLNIRALIVDDEEIRTPVSCIDCVSKVKEMECDGLLEKAEECAREHMLDAEDIGHSLVYLGWIRSDPDGDCFIAGVDIYGSETTKSVNVTFSIAERGVVHSMEITGGSSHDFFNSEDYVNCIAGGRNNLHAIEIWNSK